LNSPGAEEVEELETVEAGELPPAKKAVEKLPVKLTMLFAKSIFPVLLIDSDFTILYANTSCRKLFTSFAELEGRSFFDVFGKSIGVDALREIHETVKDGKNGYAWKGFSQLKRREVETVLSKLFIFPYTQSNVKPWIFEVIFDDVTEEKKQLLRSVFLSLLEASKLKDSDTGKHIVRVSRYSRRLSQALYYKRVYPEVDADFIENISFLASMHDVGKIGTPDDILNKAGALTDWEWTVMREHTKNGAYILSTYPDPMAREIAIAHHERWDGAGYPFQLQGEMIPLPARIVAIADVYDALRMERSYKSAVTHEKALELMLAEKGTHFDPVLLDLFVEINADFNTIYERYKDKPEDNPRN
jgi:putative two-component system response regulator